MRNIQEQVTNWGRAFGQAHVALIHVFFSAEFCDILRCGNGFDEL